MMQTAADVQQQYDQSGNAADLEFAIDTWSRLRDLVQREPRVAAAVLGHDMTARALNELGLDLLDSARRAAGTERFHEAAEVLHNAADWAEPGSRWRTDALVNASHVLMRTWERSAAPTDLDAAVAAAEAAITAKPATRASRANAMNVLGNALRMRGRSESRTEDLRRAVDAHAEAVETTGSGTPDTARFLVTLGHAQRALAAATGDAALLDAAVTTFGDARLEVSDERDLIPALEGLQESLGARGAPADLLAQADILTSIASEHAGKPVLAATDLERAITAVRNVPGSEHFLADSEFPAPRSPLVYLTGTTNGGLGLVVHPDGQVEVLWLPQLEAYEVRARVRTWLTAYDARAEDRSGWAHTFDATLRWAWTAAMGHVVECLRGQERATLVPGGLLGLLPLHAAWISDSAKSGGRRYALDELLLSYTPSAAILEEVSVGVPVHAPRSLLAVADPQPVSAAPLPWATREVSNAARCFSSVKVLVGPQATRTSVAEHLDGHDVLHFACHGFADTADPRRSALILADDEPLTLADLASMRLTAGPGERPRLAVLSACESGMPGGALPDEVVGLPTGLLSAGVHGVVSSLVTVPDAATGLPTSAPDRVIRTASTVDTHSPSWSARMLLSTAS